MRRHSLWGFVYWSFSALQWIVGIGLACFAAATKADPKNWPWAGVSLAWLQETAWLFIPLFTVGLGLLQVLRSATGPPWIWQHVHYLLNTFREHVFEKERGVPLHYNRVTLFKHVRFRWALCKWPWSGWLIPMERSGHTTQRSRTAFLVPDNADLVQGIAGQTWAQNRVVMVNELPDLNESPAPELFEQYARKTWVSVRWLQSRSQHGRAFCGIPVEVKGRMWGVIVIDSRSPDAIDQEAVNVYRLVGRYLGKLLERA
jgi:GAF domain